MTIELVCPWSFGGKTDPQTQEVIPPACADLTWTDRASFVEHLLAEHGGPRGWTRVSAEREAAQQWLAREQDEIDAAQRGDEPNPCGAVLRWTVAAGEDLLYGLSPVRCALSVHAGDHSYTSADGAITVSWKPEEEPLALLERL